MKFFFALTKKFAFCASFVFTITGCSSVTYKSNSMAGPAKPANYPIPVYTREMPIPRPCEIIGTVSIKPGSFSMSGGSSDAELKKILEYAHEKGADVVEMTDVKTPDFINPHYGLTANLLRYTDIWETIPISYEKFQAYLNANRKNLDPIEGIWFSGESSPHVIGVITDKSKRGRDFVGFILNANNPVWRAGTKKIDIRRGLAPGSYVLTYYLEDFERRQTLVLLGQKTEFTLDFPNAEGDYFITYVKK